MTSEGSAPTKVISNGCTVLIVEDHADIRDGMRILLEERGYRVVIAENGHAALRQLYRLNETPCLILLDLMMPTMDGWQFLEELRRTAAFSKIPVVITSVADLRVECFYQVVAYLKKPIVFSQLLSILPKVLSGKNNGSTRTPCGRSVGSEETACHGICKPEAQDLELS